MVQLKDYFEEHVKNDKLFLKLTPYMVFYSLGWDASFERKKGKKEKDRRDLERKKIFIEGIAVDLSENLLNCFKTHLEFIPDDTRLLLLDSTINLQIFRILLNCILDSNF